MACAAKRAFSFLNKGNCLLSDHDAYITASKESHAKFYFAWKAIKTQGGTKLLGETMWRLAAVATCPTILHSQWGHEEARGLPEHEGKAWWKQAAQAASYHTTQGSIALVPSKQWCPGRAIAGNHLYRAVREAPNISETENEIVKKYYKCVHTNLMISAINVRSPKRVMNWLTYEPYHH